MDELAVDRFSLLRSYALISFLVMVTMGALNSYVFSNHLTNILLARDADALQGFLQSMSEVGDGDPNVFGFIDNNRPGDEPELNNNLPELVVHLSTMSGIIRANLYSIDGKVLWSTQKELIDQQFPYNPELEEAEKGERVYELKEINENDKEEYMLFDSNASQLIENYLPIWDIENNRVVAVVEIYRSPKGLLDSIESARNLVWFSTWAATLFLYLTLFWIVFRANRLILKQHLYLVESETLVAVGEMASTVAHSIRNPLASIRSSAELTAETSQDQTTREFAEDIMVETDRLGQWVRELLVFSRPDSSTFRAANLDEILDECIAGYKRMVARNRVKIVYKKDESMPSIAGDHGLLGQMFNSILANSIEAMPNGGTLRVEIHNSKSEDVVQVAISDTGYGIQPELIERIFERHSTTKEGGLGIGMFLVKRIVERHMGNIFISSKIGSGTTVYFRFPTA